MIMCGHDKKLLCAIKKSIIIYYNPLDAENMQYTTEKKSEWKSERHEKYDFVVNT